MTPRIPDEAIASCRSCEARFPTESLPEDQRRTADSVEWAPGPGTLAPKGADMRTRDLAVALLVAVVAPAHAMPPSAPERPRLLVLTDISSLTAGVAEPDEIRADPFPSGHTSRQAGRMTLHPDGRADAEPWP